MPFRSELMLGIPEAAAPAEMLDERFRKCGILMITTQREASIAAPSWASLEQWPLRQSLAALRLRRQPIEQRKST
jgi:hypothetical protein